MVRTGPPDVPQGGSYCREDEFRAFNRYRPALFTAFLAVRRSLLMGQDRPAIPELARQMKTSSGAVGELLQALEQMGALGREKVGGPGERWRYVIRPVEAWQPLRGALAERLADPEYYHPGGESTAQDAG